MWQIALLLQNCSASFCNIFWHCQQVFLWWHNFRKWIVTKTTDEVHNYKCNIFQRMWSKIGVCWKISHTKKHACMFFVETSFHICWTKQDAPTVCKFCSQNNQMSSFQSSVSAWNCLSACMCVWQFGTWEILNVTVLSFLHWLWLCLVLFELFCLDWGSREWRRSVWFMMTFTCAHIVNMTGFPLGLYQTVTASGMWSISAGCNVPVFWELEMCTTVHCKRLVYVCCCDIKKGIWLHGKFPEIFSFLSAYHF